MALGVGCLFVAVLFATVALNRRWASGDAGAWVAGTWMGWLLRRTPLWAGRTFLLFWSALATFGAAIAFTVP